MTHWVNMCIPYYCWVNVFNAYTAWEEGAWFKLMFQHDRTWTRTWT